MKIELTPVGFVRSEIKNIQDDNWDAVQSCIELTGEIPEESLWGITDFSHVQIIFYFDRVQASEIVAGARHPRNNKNWPLTGIFAQRAKNRPNRLGSTIVKVVDCKGRQLMVSGLDAVNGTPVLDIKPVMKAFLPRENTRQPAWPEELMRNYWISRD